MRRILALILAGMMLLASCAFAEGEAIFSYDFDMRLHLDAEQLPFRERAHIKGYADLLEMLELRGNYSYCPATDCSDLYLDVIPVTNPSSALSFHIWGLPNMHSVTSPLFADKVLCFNPGAFLGYSLSAREVFRLSLLPRVALLNPRTSRNAFTSLTEVWNRLAGEMPRGGNISVKTLQAIAAEWENLMESRTKISYWSSAMVDPALDDGMALQDLHSMPGQLLNAAGNKRLTKERKAKEGRTVIRNAAGFTLWEQTETEKTTAYTLNLPEELKRYFPAFSVRRDTEDGRMSFALDAEWACAAETATADAETGAAKQRLDLHFAVDGLPASLPAETSLSGSVRQGGFLFPEFSFLLDGTVAGDGQVRVSLRFEDRPESSPVFACEGRITPSAHPEPMNYLWQELNTEYNILNLSYDAQRALIDTVKKPLLLGMIDFLYEVPASSCQSIMDDLENSGVLKMVLSDLQ